MSNIRIEIVPGSFTNENAYENLINYISKPKAIIGGCGIYPFTSEAAINQFYLTKLYSLVSSPDERYLWHFFVSFENAVDLQFLRIIATSICISFSDNYQSFFGIHLDTDHQHIHFAINAYSFHPYAEKLTEPLLQEYMQNIISYLSNQFNTSNITLQFGRKIPHV